MKIAKGHVVTISVAMLDVGHNLLPETVLDSAAYLHGSDDLFPKIQQALEGKGVGDKVEVELQPDEAFGEYSADLIIKKPRSSLPAGLTEKSILEATNAKSGESHLFRVIKLTDTDAILSGNHPLAGQSLFAVVEVKAVEPATPEQIANGTVFSDN